MDKKTMKRAGLFLAVCGLLSQGTAQAESWADKLKIKGDFRLRHEMIAEQDKAQRDRERYRARLGILGTLSEELEVGIQFASGEANQDPVSTNQTLTGSFSGKTVRIDLAYFDYRPGVLEGFRVSGGKIRNPMITLSSSDLIWDFDLNPEGLTVGYTRYGMIEPFLKLSGFSIQENAADADSALWAFQGGAKAKVIPDKAYVLAGLSYFDYANAQNKPIFGVDATKSFGNTTTTSGTTLLYSFDYNLLEAFLELGYPLGGIDTALFYDFVTNQDRDINNEAWMLGLNLSGLLAERKWKFGYNYRRIETDAVVGAFSDSDFIGGGTNGKGHKFSLSYDVTKNVTPAIAYIDAEKNIAPGQNEKDYERLEIDMNFKF
ncbi:MAG: putative porin [Deltaproteobacteria bacterium]|nr:putative porin [Deltaproteobacteria bacterium]